MPLNIGNREATEGMAGTIYQAIDAELRPAMEKNDVKPEDVGYAQVQWKSLSYAIAAGVIHHLKREPSTQADFAEAFTSANEDAVFWTWLAGFLGVFNNWTPIPQDGGAALKTALTAWLAANPVPAELKGIIK